MQDKIHNTRIIVIGGSSGIGFAVARLALASGAAKVFIGSSNQARVDAAVVKLNSDAGEGKAEGYALDATKEEQIKAFFDRVGQFDHLVWTSGDHLRAGFPDIDLSANRDIFDVRFWGPVQAAQYVHQKGLIAKTGSITLTIGSVVRKPYPGWSLLAGMAGAVSAVTKGLAVDLRPTRVNVVAPGLVDTELWASMAEDQKRATFAAAAEKLLVQHVATPDEVAETYLFLMRCGFITGEQINVDGGTTLV